MVYQKIRASRIKNQESKIKDQRSKIKDQRSKIKKYYLMAAKDNKVNFLDGFEENCQ